MEDLLYVKDYYFPVFTNEKPSDKIDKEWEFCHHQFLRENPNGKGKETKAGDSEDGEKVAAATDDFLIIYEGDAVNVACQETSWVIDSGASIHVTSRRDFFRSYTPGDFGSVRMGNDGIAKVVGMGDVHLETENGNTLVLRGVKHVPNIRMNLISTDKLDDEGFCNTFRDGKWKLTKGSLIVARGQKYSSLYVMNVKIVDPMINAVDDERTVELWHNRLSHMSEKGLTVLSKKNLVPGVKTDLLKKCAHCLAGKQTRVAFKRVPHPRKTSILDMVHSDVCGPMKRRTLGGALYFVNFIDDHSRKIWVYMLKSKDQVVDVFKQFHARVERETCVKLKCIRTDNGGEYCGPFDEYCRQHGIRHQKTPPKTPQLNGLVERTNRTLVERPSAIHLSKNSSFHLRSKHIEVRYHWIRNVLESKQLHLAKVHTSENGADMMKKTLPKEKLEVCRRRAGLLEPTT
ncbi:Uncharacterized mitochondrial protein AtMg00300 [Striga hermonthica]|uniref:Uncharacterized mitochondrial protein AtMg00300 n=1 Tax=Striga hermonthica TaxID=68872 RepID=A0A9N7NGH1_STRHE|nr:Uncharacterized mitochondrial protein AtMg00300 [Striga hermonthica]